MSAYLIVENDVTDPDRYEEVIRLTPPTVALYGGKYLARGGETETIEGEWQPKRVVIIEFESMEQARAWWNSTEYRPALDLRHQTARTKMILTEGL
jgi:uncharacterized protein (DUF1330 family)